MCEVECWVCLCLTEPVPVKTVENPFAVERPRAPASLFTRQGSLRVRRGPSEDYTSGVDQQTASPFKRQLSLRLDQLPSNVLRQRQLAPNLPSLRPSAALRAGNSPPRTIAHSQHSICNVSSTDCSFHQDIF